MRKLLIAAALAATAFGGIAYAEDASKPLTAQQQRMKDCNAEAKSKELKGQARKDFMKVCLSGGGDKAAAASAAKKP